MPRKDINSKRTLNFIKRNSPNYERCRDYIIDLLDHVFEIKNYEFKNYYNDELALFINCNNIEYVLYIDYDFIELKVEKNRQIVRRFTKDNCWMCGLEYIIKECERT